MKFNSRLTKVELLAELQKLQQQQLKSSKVPIDKTNDIKHSYIQKLHMKSSMFTYGRLVAILKYL